jgi:hypothetical protein
VGPPYPHRIHVPNPVSINRLLTPRSEFAVVSATSPVLRSLHQCAHRRKLSDPPPVVWAMPMAISEFAAMFEPLTSPSCSPWEPEDTVEGAAASSFKARCPDVEAKPHDWRRATRDQGRLLPQSRIASSAMLHYFTSLFSS